MVTLLVGGLLILWVLKMIFLGIAEQFTQEESLIDTDIQA